MSIPQGMLSPQLFIAAARAIAQETASRHRIHLTADALQGVDQLVLSNMNKLTSKFQSGVLDVAGWEFHVRQLAETVANELVDAGTRSLQRSDQFVPLVEAKCHVFPFD